MRIFRAMGIIAAIALIAGQASASDSALTALQTGDDSRPYRAVGKLELGTGGFCTATLMTDRLVLTAAHCVTDDAGTLARPGSLRFLAGLRDGRADAYRGVRRIAVSPDYDAGGTDLPSLAGDVALIELDRPVDPAIIKPIPVSQGTGFEVGVVSYARDRADRPALQETCRVLGETAGAMITSCSADFGTSGAPVLAIRDGTLSIVSVISAMAQMDGEKVSIGADLSRLLPGLIARLEAGDGVFFRAAPTVRRLSADEARQGGPGKFVRP